MLNISRILGQRDGIAGLMATIRSENDIEEGVLEYLRPYINWDTIGYFIERNGKKLIDNEEYDMGLLGTVNYMKAAIINNDNLKQKVMFLCEQYDIHFEEKSSDHERNPHVKWVKNNFEKL